MEEVLFCAHYICHRLTVHNLGCNTKCQSVDSVRWCERFQSNCNLTTSVIYSLQKTRLLSKDNRNKISSPLMRLFPLQINILLFWKFKPLNPSSLIEQHSLALKVCDKWFGTNFCTRLPSSSSMLESHTRSL